MAVSPPAAIAPQPKGNFVIGHLAPVARDPLGQLTLYARQYGDVVKLRLLHLRAMLVCHPRLVEQVLVTRGTDFFKSIDTRETKVLLGNGLLTSEGDLWRRHRRAMLPAFHQGRMARYCRTITTGAGEIADSWRDGERRDLRPEMTRIALRGATRALFGANLASEEGEIGRAIDSLSRLFDFTSSCAYLLPTYLPTPIHLRALAAMRRLGRMIEKIVRERRESGRPGEDVLDLILELARRENGSGDKTVRDEVMTLLIAGHETTSAALAWTWYLLAQNPGAEEKLHEELDRVLGGRAPGHDDLPRLVYTGRVVNEALRMFPPVWTIGREALRDTEIGGYAVPKGTTVYMPQWVVHRDPRFYPNPERFDPDRWTDGFSRSLPPFAFFPFGAGPRMCIGGSFAQMEANLVLATIARKFRFTLAPGARVTPWPSVTLRPRNGLPVTIHRRRHARTQ